MTDVLVTFAHLRRLHYCAPRIKDWCKKHDIDVHRFKRDIGVPASELRATGCGLAIKAAELAEREASQ